jgi:hypothetical protein
MRRRRPLAPLALLTRKPTDVEVRSSLAFTW